MSLRLGDTAYLRFKSSAAFRKAIALPNPIYD